MKNKGIFLLITILFAFVHTTSLQAQESSVNGDDLLGHWYMERMTIRIFKGDNGKYFGKIVHLENQENFRNLTPDTALILRNFTYKGEKEWDDGTVFVTFINQHLDCDIEMLDYNTLKMTARKGFISKSKTWSRVHNYTSRN